MTFYDNEFLTSFKNIYPKSLDLKVERQGHHVSFLDLDIKVGDTVFTYKPFDKKAHPACDVAATSHFGII